MPRPFATPPLDDAELDQLQTFLEDLPAGAMNLEEVDGFFAGLLSAPQQVSPEAWLALVWGEAADREASFDDADQAQQILDLLLRHWNAMAERLDASAADPQQIHLPLLFEDDDGVVRANAWARGYTRAMQLSPIGWDALLDSEEEGGALIPMMMLAHEHDEDPESRTPPIAPEQREDLISYLVAGLNRAYMLLAPQRRAQALAARQATTFRRSAAKTGRNDPCPCGSGRKFKLCCGRAGAVQG